MPRPRMDSDVPPATQRMRDAFWTLLTDREYRRITVTDVVREARVNRNSFYYHFSGLPELADSAILTEVASTPLVQDAPDPSEENPQQAWERRLTRLLDTPSERRRLDRLALLAGPHSSPELIDSLRDFGRMTLMQMLELDTDRLDLKTDLLVDFSVGGMLAILRRWPELSRGLDSRDLFNEDVAVLAMGIYLSMSKEDMLAYWKRVFNQHD